ncbi:hypothetical protein A2U01_0032517, partial [Trifolium medium]|nr:hypothetical protein [Trifolium medium]
MREREVERPHKRQHHRQREPESDPEPEANLDHGPLEVEPLDVELQDEEDNDEEMQHDVDWVCYEEHRNICPLLSINLYSGWIRCGPTR